MTQLRPPRADQSRPGQHRAGLTALAGATFVYVTAETLPIGLVPQLSAGLDVRPGTVGLLVTVYAAVAGLSAVPLTAALEHRSRRQVVVGCATVLALSQFVIAVAPGYPVVMAAARIVCALTHGVFWSMLAPVAARLVAPGQGGRATALVFTGNSVALVLGVPLGTALGHLIGWRPTMAALLATVAAVVVWGAAFTALPVCLQGAVLRVAPRSTDTASALFVVAFQIGIGGGALAGSLLVDAGELSALCVTGAALAAAGLLVVLAARRAFPPSSPRAGPDLGRPDRRPLQA